MKRKVLYTGLLDAEERATVIRYAIEVGDRATCRTNCLLRPLTGDLLEEAFRERERKIEERVRTYEERVRVFDPSATTAEFRSFFGGEVTKEKFAKYIDDLIKEEEAAKASLRRAYSVAVDYASLTPEDEAFHRSLSPRVTFGDTTELHELCDFALTRDIKDAFLDSSLGDDPEDGFDFGAFYLGKTPLFYEDICVSAGGEKVLETISRDEVMDVFLTEGEMTDFIDFELNKTRNRKIIKKLIS